MEEQRISLKVLKGYRKDIGSLVTRVHLDTIDYLDIPTGSIIKIRGKRIIYAKAMPFLVYDDILKRTNAIRMNSNLRADARVEINDTVYVSAYETKPITKNVDTDIVFKTFGLNV